MRAISNAFFWQVEVVQEDRWDHGPLELVVVDQASRKGPLTDEQIQLRLAISEWNRSTSGGFTRPGEALETLEQQLGVLGVRRANPNVIFVPRGVNGVTQLHVMLASLLPEDRLRRAVGLPRMPALLDLSLVGTYELPSNFATASREAFSTCIWQKLAPAARQKASFFAPTSPLRLLADDASFWMHRIYRIALDRQEEFGEVDDRNHNWTSLSELDASLRATLPSEYSHLFYLRRPLFGGDVWDVNDADEREQVLDEAIHGAGVMDSLEPVVELLHRQRAHEDFSDRHSWVRGF